MSTTSKVINQGSRLRSHGKNRGKGKHVRQNQHARGGSQSLSPRKSPGKFIPEDFRKIIDFLKSQPSPQETITIAKACGYTSKSLINPTLYALQDKGLVKKTNGSPPIWALNEAGMPINQSKKSFGTYSSSETSMNREWQNNYNDSRNYSRGSRGHVGYKRDGRFRGRNRGRGRIFHPSQNYDTFDQRPWQVNQKSAWGAGNSNLPAAQSHSLNHENMFKNTASDRSAPGAYQPKVDEHLEHSHDKRYEVQNSKRKHSTNFPHSERSKPKTSFIHSQSSEAVGWGENEQGQVSSDKNMKTSQSQKLFSEEEEHPVKAGPSQDNTGCSSFSAQSSVQQESPARQASTTEYSHTGGYREVAGTSADDSEYSNEDDDEEGYLAARVADVLSRQSSGLVKMSDSEGPFHTTISCSDEMYENYTMDFNEGDVYEEIYDDQVPSFNDDVFKLLSKLSGVPMNVTDINNLSLLLQWDITYVQGVLQECETRNLIDYSQLKHIRLTEEGKMYVQKLQQSSARPPSPAQLLETNSLFGNIESRLDVKRIPAGRGTLGHLGKLNSEGITMKSSDIHGGEPYDARASFSENSFEENGPRGHSLMPWMIASFSLPFNNTVKPVPSNTGQPTSLPLSLLSPATEKPALLPDLLPPSLSSNSSQTFGQQLLREKKTDIPGMEYLVLSDQASKGQSLFSNQSQQRRSPLLSTPPIRGSNPILKSLPGISKTPLLPFPGQPAQAPSFLQSLGSQHQVPKESLTISTESFAALNKNPISAFMEYGQSRHLPARIDILDQKGPPHKPVFFVAAVLGNRVFPGITSSNKKDGKKEAAEQAMRMLIAEGQYNVSQNPSLMSIPEENMTIFDKIAALTHRKFNQLIATIPESLVGRKVIAGLVMKMNEEDIGSVIAIGSGNRCITGDKLSLQGLTVNDCHAEIITRRGFMRFLYYQLKTYVWNRDHPLFEPSPNGKLKIKDTVSFHLYISTAPCGDGALFSPRDVESNTGTVTDALVVHKPTFDTSVQGVLRTKMEGGEGTIPMDPSRPVQTWDGIVRGERLRTMSCSDKICRWNVLGLQGALLTHFLDPVFLNSITLGFLFDAGHLSRAVCCRLNRGEPHLNNQLPPPYFLCHPRLGRVTACDPTRETQKTKAFSVNWMAEDERPEVVDGSIGTCYSGEQKGDTSLGPAPSRLCKRFMYDQFKELCQQFGREELLQAPTYHMAKRMNNKFELAKEALNQKFRTTGCGTWLDKPIEEKMFS